MVAKSNKGIIGDVLSLGKPKSKNTKKKAAKPKPSTEQVVSRRIRVRSTSPADVHMTVTASDRLNTQKNAKQAQKLRKRLGVGTPKKSAAHYFKQLEEEANKTAEEEAKAYEKQEDLRIELEYEGDVPKQEKLKRAYPSISVTTQTKNKKSKKVGGRRTKHSEPLFEDHYKDVDWTKDPDE